MVEPRPASPKVNYYTSSRRDAISNPIHNYFSFSMLWKLSLPRGRPLRTLILVTFTLGITYYVYNLRHNGQSPASIDTIAPFPTKPPPAKSKPLACLSLPGAENVVVVLKTSAAELEQKLPDLLSSTLKCFPNYLIFSDYTETHAGQPIIDALENISPKIKSTHPDFDLYRRLQKGGPDALEDEEMWSADKTSHKLDKWKMLPIIHTSFEKYKSDKHKKWYVFIDLKSHFFQSNLLLWLNNDLDPSEPYFLNIQGSQDEASMLLDSGSFVLSYPAIEAISAEYTAKKAAYEQLTNERATGHSVLRQIVEKARSRTTSLQMTKSWPMFHPLKPARIDYGEQSFFEKLWCYPTIFYEGLTTGEIVELWKFEQVWIEMHQPKGEILKHSDVFNEYILPRLTIRSGKVDDWDNLSGELREGVEAGNVEECMKICVEREKCVQYSFGEGRCMFSDIPKMGEARNGWQSRWLLAKVQKWAKGLDGCTGEESWS